MTVVAKRLLTGKNNSSLLQTQNDSGLFNIYFQYRQWICFLRMQDGLISKSAWMNTRNIRRGRFAFVDIANGRDGVTRDFSQSLTLWLFKNNAKFTDCATYMYILILSRNEINHI